MCRIVRGCISAANRVETILSRLPIDSEVELASWEGARQGWGSMPLFSFTGRRLRRSVWAIGPWLLAGTVGAQPKAKTDKDDKSEKAATSNASFVAKKPPPSTQVSKSVAERGGVNPCNTDDPGFGLYDKWTRGIDMGQLIMPANKKFARGGQFDVMFHFHGHESARKEWITVMHGAVLVGIDLGLGSGPYETAFGAPEAFERLIGSVERAVEKKTGHPAKARKVGVSAWSAGY